METSCGVVLVNYGSILLLQHPQGHWDFPKGHVEPTDAGYQAAAARELEEETGITDVRFLDGFRERTTYSFRVKGRRIDKQVYWFVADTDEMDVTLSHEHRQYLWLDWDAASARLTHENSREILAAARRRWEAANGLG